MEIKITNVYDNKALEGQGFAHGKGQAFHIAIGSQQMLFDMGAAGAKLLHNLKRLGISPNEIDKVVLSHGHSDHTGGLPAFLKARTLPAPLPVFGHPALTTPKAKKLFGIYLPLGLPKLNPRLREKVKFQFSRGALEILPHIYTTGEITEREELTGLDARLYYKVGQQWQPDPLLDDISLVLRTAQGSVIVTGCCHAGILNTCAAVVELFEAPIIAIVGGLHLRRSSGAEVEHIAQVLVSTYGQPRLYLNHCTGKTSLEQLLERLGPQTVQACPVGTELSFTPAVAQ